jgi:hypothetical protein
MASPTLDRFAELLADGVATGDAAVLMGHPRAYGKSLLKRLRRKLGWQAQ